MLALNLRIAVGEIPPVLSDLPLNDLARSILVAIPVLCFAAAAFAGPPLSRRIGEERGLLIMCGALCVGLVMRPWWGAAYLFAGTVVCGLSIAVMNVMMPSVIRRRFAGHLGELTAAYTMSLSVGAGLAAGLTVPLVGLLGTVPPALAVWAVPAVLAFVLWVPQLRRPRPAPRAAGSSSGVLRDAHAWHITLYFGLQSALYYTVVSWLPTIYRDQGTSPVAAGAVLGVLSTVGIIGNFAAPMLAQRSGRAREMVAVTGLMSAIGLLGVLLYPTLLPLLWATLLGVGTGGAFSLTLLLMAARAHDSAVAAQLAGMAQGVGYMISALGPLSAGLLHSAFGGWTIPLALTLCVCAAQVAIGLQAARPGVVGASDA